VAVKIIPPLVMAKSKKFNHNIFLCLISRSHSEARIFSHHRQHKALSLSLSLSLTHTHTHTHAQLSRRISTINIILCFISRSRSEARIFPHHRQTTFSLSFIGQLHSACYTPPPYAFFSKCVPGTHLVKQTTVKQTDPPTLGIANSPASPAPDPADAIAASCALFVAVQVAFERQTLKPGFFT
jgi:hypothetical protein